MTTRQAGDTAIFTTDYGVHILYYVNNGNTTDAGCQAQRQLLEQIRQKTDFDVDAVLLYRDDTPVQQVLSAAAQLRKTCNVLTVTALPKNLRWRKLYELREGEAVLLENNG